MTHREVTRYHGAEEWVEIHCSCGQLFESDDLAEAEFLMESHVTQEYDLDMQDDWHAEIDIDRCPHGCAEGGHDLDCDWR